MGGHSDVLFKADTFQQRSKTIEIALPALGAEVGVQVPPPDYPSFP
jgi:hypothetical protein